MEVRANSDQQPKPEVLEGATGVYNIVNSMMDGKGGEFIYRSNIGQTYDITVDTDGNITAVDWTLCEVQGIQNMFLAYARSENIRKDLKSKAGNCNTGQEQ